MVMRWEQLVDGVDGRSGKQTGECCLRMPYDLEEEAESKDQQQMNRRERYKKNEKREKENGDTSFTWAFLCKPCDSVSTRFGLKSTRNELK